MQIKKSEAQRAIDKKIPVLILAVVKKLERAVESSNLGELGFRAGF
jgi:hypothetical protein